MDSNKLKVYKIEKEFWSSYPLTNTQKAILAYQGIKQNGIRDMRRKYA